MSIRSKLIVAAVATSAMVVSAAAHAGAFVPPNVVPEPGTLALVGLAAVVGIVVARNRRK